MTLQECKDYIAKGHGHNTFADYLTYVARVYKTDHPEYVPDIIKIVDKATKLYAQEKVKEGFKLLCNDLEDVEYVKIIARKIEKELLNKIEKE